MRFVQMCVLFAAATLIDSGNAESPAQPPSGDQILARAGSAEGLNSYSVPVHFNVHLHKPIGLKAGVDAIVYYKAPAQAALTITKSPFLLRSLFKGTYAIDLAVQVWPSKYTVTSVTPGQSGDNPAFLLQAVPKAPDPSVDHVTFTVAQNSYTPLAAEWYYKDGSTIQLSISNGSQSSYFLPSTETIAVSMPHYKLEADGTFGQYALNSPIPDSVFQKP